MIVHNSWKLTEICVLFVLQNGENLTRYDVTIFIKRQMNVENNYCKSRFGNSCFNDE